MPRRLTGIRRKRGGWQAYVRIDGQLHTKQFSIDHPIADIRTWREQQIDKFGGRRASTGSFAADVATFLEKPEVAAQPFVRQTELHLDRWASEIGRDRPRYAVERDELEAIIQRWLLKYAEPTVYHMRSALLRLFTVLDGPGAANPVKETTCPRAWTPADHSVPFPKLERIVSAMPEWHFPKAGIKQKSAARIVARVIIAIGLRPVDLLKVRHADIDWHQATLLWPSSKKGHGVAARRVPLTPEGINALREFDAADLYGAFCHQAISRSFKRAARKIDGPKTKIHLYSGRHALGADLYRATRDLATVGRLLNHAEGSRATAQYAQGANADVDRAAVDALSKARAVHASSPKLPKKLPARRKIRKFTGLRRMS